VEFCSNAKGKGKAVLLGHRQSTMTTYSEAVCHAGQHKEKVYTVFI